MFYWSYSKGAQSNYAPGLIVTLVSAAIFECFEVLEHRGAPFTISEGIYGLTPLTQEASLHLRSVGAAMPRSPHILRNIRRLNV